MSLDTWDAPSGVYTSTIPPGMAAFRSVVAEHFGYSRTEVVRDRSRCAATKSEHCECGACDFFTTIVVKGRELFDWCVEVSEPLGIQSVIFNRRVVGFGDPDERLYQGPSAHTDHVHVGLNREARRRLTEAQVRALLPQEDDMFTDEDRRKLEAVWKDHVDKVSGASDKGVLEDVNGGLGAFLNDMEDRIVERVVTALKASDG